ncbi:unnamed protein product [Cylindrotheca closterium]|uniref:Uncharacterized protein n=1 Tax=Cylindrotheca closterium TaxID=2856 RepID=A0AAD2FR51_9STRA|nr:unnamed protein product [Cylindrotheca closterium]
MLGLPDGMVDGTVDGNIDGLELGGNDTSTLQQTVEQKAFGGGQQSPVKPSVAQPGFAEHAAELIVSEGLEDLEGALLGIVDGVVDGFVDGAADGAVDGGVDGVADGKESPNEQQVRNVTPSEVGQQSPAKPEQSGCAEHAASTVPGVTEGAEDLEGALLGIADGVVDGKMDGFVDGAADGAVDGGVDGVADGEESPNEQQVRNVTPSEVGQQSPVKPEQSGCAEHAASTVPGVTEGAEDFEGALLGIVDGVIDGDTDDSGDGIVDGVVDGGVDGVADGEESPDEQQVRNVTPSEVGQQSPAKPEQAGCAEHAASTAPDVTDGVEDFEGAPLGFVDGVVDGLADGAADGEVFGDTDGIVDGATDGEESPNEQQVRKVTPSAVGQQSPAKPEQAGCAEHAADTVPCVTEGADDFEGALLGISDGVADGDEIGATEGGLESVSALNEQQVRKVTPSEVGQQSPVKPEQSGCAEHAADNVACAFDGAVDGVADAGDVLGDPVAALDIFEEEGGGEVLGETDVVGETDGDVVCGAGVDEQHARNTPSTVGQQLPSKPSHLECAEHAAWIATGDAVGTCDGGVEGKADTARVTATFGDVEGTCDGITEGKADAPAFGEAEGDLEGTADSILVGTFDGSAFGPIVGTWEGTFVGGAVAPQQSSVTPSAVGQHSPERFRSTHAGCSSHVSEDTNGAGVGILDGINDGNGVVGGVVPVVGIADGINDGNGVFTILAQQSSMSPSSVGQQKPSRPAS